MKMQSLSVVVPNKKCINNCKFCVSKMHGCEYVNQIEENKRFADLYERDMIARMNFARDNGCNTVMLTGDSEPQTNETFLWHFADWNAALDKPFRKIEMQTTGAFIDDEKLRFLRNKVGVSSIALSVSSFDDVTNNYIIGTPKNGFINLESLCSEIKKYDFNLRICLNLQDVGFEPVTCVDDVGFYFMRARDLMADQLTFRVIYDDPNSESEESVWCREHKFQQNTVSYIADYIKQNGRVLDVLEYGQVRYSVHGISTIIDDDCMSSAVKDTAKYCILRPNAKLYTKWDDRASLIF